MDFEKAYGTVDWDFLEGTLLLFGFSNAWVRGVSSLYISARSQVLLDGSKETEFRFLDQFARDARLLLSLFILW